MDRDRLRTVLGGFEGKRVLVVGDCMLDAYIWGHVNRISPEAPVMVVEEQETTYAAGGASNAAVNIVAMGGIASMVSIVGDDAMGLRLCQEFERQGVRHEGVVVHPHRPTTVKTRVFAHSQQVVRVDREERTPVAAEVAERLIERVRREMQEADAVLLSDYGKGVLTERVVSSTIQAALAEGKPVFANAKPPSIRYYQGVSLVQLNQPETESVTGLRLTELSVAEEAGDRLLRVCGARAAMITLGSRGLGIFQQGKPWRHLPVVSPEVYDACGCGDTVIAAATLAHSAGAAWEEAAQIANLAGNAKVGKLGVVPVTRGEIENIWTMSPAAGSG